MRCQRQKTGGITYTDAQVAAALERWKRGESSEAIAADIGCGETTVDWWARRAGLRRPRPVNNHRHTKLVRATAVRLYVEGRSARWIAEVLGDGIDKRTVMRWVKAAGITPRPDNPNTIDEQRVSAVYAETKSVRRTSKLLGISQSGVRSALNRALRLRVRQEIATEQGATT